ncbi:hypothetical protein BDR04DRAFT_1152322 [Suillus decipiens]|nr:hypothetical protein BDR04DRAFT_1152322 [Suillus decipiens]
MAGTHISTHLKKPTEKAAVQPHHITKARTRAPRSKPSPKKSKKRKLAVSESSDDDLVDDSDDSIVTAACTLGKKATSKAASKSDRAHRKSNASASIEVVELEDSPTDDEEEPDDMDRGGPGSTMDGEDISQSALHFLGSI